MLCLSLTGRKRNASWSPHHHLLGKPLWEPSGRHRNERVPRGASGSGGGITVEHGRSRSFSEIPSSLQSLRQDFSQPLGKAGWGWRTRFGKESESILCELGAIFIWFILIYFFLRLGTRVFLRRPCSLVHWEPHDPGGTTGTIWNPYKSEGSCECIMCEVEKGRGEGV